MARQMSATNGVGLSTFLLEVALDRARMKQRFAAALLEARRQRGAGNPRDFPQPEMARELGYSIRQYQRLENPNLPDLPTWAKIEQIADALGFDLAVLFADGNGEANGQTSSREDLLQSVRADLAEVLGLVQRIESRLRQAEHLSEEDRA